MAWCSSPRLTPPARREELRTGTFLFLAGFHPESALFLPGCVNLRVFLCGDPSRGPAIWIEHGSTILRCLRVAARADPSTPPRKPLISSTFRWGAGQPGNGGAPNCTRHDEKCLLSELETLSISSGVSGWILAELQAPVFHWEKKVKTLIMSAALCQKGVFWKVKFPVYGQKRLTSHLLVSKTRPF